MEIKQFDTADEVAEYAATNAIEILSEAIRTRGRAYWVLAGGTSPVVAYKILAEKYGTALDWSKVVVAVGDERCVELDDPASNWGGIRSVFSSNRDTDAVVGIDPHAYLGGEEGAKVFETLLLDALGAELAGQPDLLWLGVGEDGHTLSFFPGHSEIDTVGALAVAVHDSPKPPADRISLTLDAVAGSKHALVFAVGAAKKDALARALSDSDELPIGYVSAAVEARGGHITWAFDGSAR